ADDLRGGRVFFFQAEDGIRDRNVTGVQTCALPISIRAPGSPTTNNTQSPTGIQVGLGARPAAVQRINVQGDYTQTGNSLDLAVRSEERRVGKEWRAGRGASH